MDGLTVAINAGGASSRMGTDKAFVPVLGKPLIEHLLARIANLGQTQTILITNRPDDYAYLGLPLFQDVLPGKGALGGIYTALHYSQGAYTLTLACDMPFVNPALLGQMIDLCRADAFDVIVPCVEGYPQGLHAIYSQVCLSSIREQLDAGQLKVISFYEQVRVRYLDDAEWRLYDPKGLSFYNVNTPAELREAQRLAEEAS